MSDFTLALSDRKQRLEHVHHIWDACQKAARDSEMVEIPLSQRLVLRKVTVRQAQVLEDECRCRCNDWTKVFFMQEQSQDVVDTKVLRKHLSDSNFDGCVVLGISEDSSIPPKSDWNRLPPGIHGNSMICDSIVDLSAKVYRNSVVANTCIFPHAVVSNCGQIGSSSGFSFGEVTVPVGPESGGGRDLNLFAEDTMIEVCKQLRHGPRNVMNTAKYQQTMNVIGSFCIVRDTPFIKNIFLYDQSFIEGAASVTGATLFPTASINTASTATNVLMQWNSSIAGCSSISDVFLMEQAHCGPNSIVASTVLGPDVHVSAGEVHASVIGPNTNAHHQSLLIGILWPLGRGNVGYGANVGSNHTGRLPDQETTAGEGTFWGLSNVIKFPVDLSYAPYSIVAAGTTLPPQRVCLPFSLIVGQPEGNEIIPGWVLQSSPYTIVRSEKKYATRRKAKRHFHYTGWKILRPETVALCRWGKLVLETDSDAESLAVGANKLTERARGVGIKAYMECMQLYALRGLFEFLLERTDGCKLPLSPVDLEFELRDSSPLDLIVLDPLKASWPVFPWDDISANPWKFQKALLHDCFPMEGNILVWVEDKLEILNALEQDLARRILKSKKRDDTRGHQIVPGYLQSHVSAEEDPVVIEASANAKKTEDMVASLMLLLRSTRSKL